MSADDFTWLPDWGVSGTRKDTILKVSFGDGYEQRAPSGLNPNPREWTLTFTNRSDTDAKAIVTFLTGKNGVDTFLWTPPDGTAQGTWICDMDTVSYSPVNYDVSTVAAKFREVFG